MSNTYMQPNKSATLLGEIRISTKCQQWRGFTLQRGHFYGEYQSGLYFVTAFEPRRGVTPTEYKFYISDVRYADASMRRYCVANDWQAYWVTSTPEVEEARRKAMKDRNHLGMGSVTPPVRTPNVAAELERRPIVGRPSQHRGETREERRQWGERHDRYTPLTSGDKSPFRDL